MEGQQKAKFKNKIIYYLQTYKWRTHNLANQDRCDCQKTISCFNKEVHFEK